MHHNHEIRGDHNFEDDWKLKEPNLDSDYEGQK